MVFALKATTLARVRVKIGGSGLGVTIYTIPRYELKE